MTVNQGLLEAGIDRDPFDSHAADGTCHLTNVARTTRMIDSRNFQPGDVLSFGPFNLFAAERLLKKADEPIALCGRRLATDETALATCQMLLVAAIVLSRRLHARASQRFRPVRLLPQNEF